MLVDIEKNIIDLLKQKGLAVKAFEIRKTGTSNTAPAVRCHIEAGRFIRTGDDRKVEVDIYLDFVFKNFRDEEARRKGIYPIIEGAVGILDGSDLGLEIDELKPVRFDNITNEDDILRGEIIFQVHFTTFYYEEPIEDGEADDLISIGIEYFLKPGDDVADASDHIDMQP